MYREVYVSYSPARRVYEIVDANPKQVEHTPWCIAEESIVDETIAERIKKLNINLDEDYRIEESDISIIPFDKTRMCFILDDPIPAVKIEGREPSHIGRLARAMDRLNILHSLSNIRYNARVSMDVVGELFNIKVPAIIHYKPDDMSEVIGGFIDKLQDIKIAVLDIEVESSGTFPRRGDRVILSGLLYGTIGELGDYEILEGDGVLETVDRILKFNPHYFITYNGVGFDLPYLRAYVAKYGVGGIEDYGMRKGDMVVPCLDLYLLTKNFASGLGLKTTIARSLVSVCKDLGLMSAEEESIEKSIDYMHLKEVYEKERDKLLEYLRTDLILTYRVAVNWLQVLIILYVMTGISPWSIQILPSMGALSEYALAEYMMRRHNIALPVRTREYVYGESGSLPIYGRGHKTFARKGIFRDVLQLDFDMLYPTIYYIFKVDPTGVESTTRVEHGKAFMVPLRSKGKVIRKVIKFNGGPIHEFFTYLVNLRRLTKRLKKSDDKRIANMFKIADQAVKILINSAYGIFGKVRGYGINEVVSAFIFFKGDQILNNTVSFVENVLRRRAVYGDTDSVFIELKKGDDPEEIARAVNEYVKIMGEDLNLKVENRHKYVIVYEEKNYFCITDKDDVIIKGVHRFFAPRCIKEHLSEIIREVVERKRNPREVMAEILMKEEMLMNLFAESVKDIDDFYNEKERRFKRVSHPSVKACILGLARERGMLAGEGGRISMVIKEDDLGKGRIASAYWVRIDSGTVAIYDGEENGMIRLVKGKVSTKVASSSMLNVVITYSRSKVTRDELIRMSLNTCEPLLKILDKVYNIVREGQKKTLMSYFG